MTLKTHSKFVSIGLVVLFVWSFFPASLVAQQNDQRIFAVNQEALFNQSTFGERVRVEIETRSQAVLAENRKIEDDLTIEEQELTALRPELDAAEFRKLADAFDEKVEVIRKEQAQKTADLTAFTEIERSRFFGAAFPILVALAEELNALAIIDARSVMISSDQFDITRLAISRVNEVLGDGTTQSAPEDASENDETKPQNP